MQILTPNETVPSRIGWMIILGWIVIAVVYWQAAKPVVFPSPLEVVQSLPGLWNEGLGTELITSFMTNLEALILAAMIGLPICYVSRVPIFAPIAVFTAKLRFLGSAVFYLPFLFLINGGHDVKVALLGMGMLTSLVTSLTQTVADIPEYRFDDARTMRMSEWLSIWYVVIRGTVSEMIEAIRTNAAVGWSMLMFVEGLIRSEGGVGVMLLNQEKHVNFAEVYGIVLAILLVGITQDWVIGRVKKAVCPYA